MVNMSNFGVGRFGEFRSCPKGPRVVVIMIWVLGRYMIIRYLDP